MENLSICRICLATDVRLCSVASHLQDMFERISSMTFKREDWRPLVACYICHARLQNCYRLRTICIRSEELLTDMMSSIQFKAQGVLSTNSFSVVSTVHISIGHMLQESIECHNREEASKVFLDKQNTEDIKMDPQEEHDAHIDDDIQYSHLEDPLDVMKREPDDVETGCLLRSEDFKQRRQQRSSSWQKIFVEAISSKLHRKKEAEAEFGEPESLGARVSNKPKPVALKDTDDATTNKRKIGVNKNEQTKIITVKEAKNVIDYNKCENVVAFLENKVCEEKSTNKTLEQHVNSISSSSSKKFSCDTCKKCFTVKSRLKRHIRIHTGEKPYECNDCKKCFIDKSDLIKHTRIHTENKPYQCNVCKKCFSQKAYFQNHIRIHSGEKPHQCIVCKKCFTQKCDLANHVRIHTGEKPYQCHVCKKYYNQKRYLKTHIRTHTGDKPYQCNICKKCFIQKSDLTKHCRTHTGEKPYQCNVCKKCFAQKVSLQNHIRMHTGENR